MKDKLTKDQLEYIRNNSVENPDYNIICSECKSNNIKIDSHSEGNSWAASIAVIITCLNCGIRYYPDWYEYKIRMKDSI